MKRSDSLKPRKYAACWTAPEGKIPYRPYIWHELYGAFIDFFPMYLIN